MTAPLAQIEGELNLRHFGSSELIHLLITAMIANRHLIILGPPGSGKSFLLDDVMSRVEGASTFSTSLHEDGDPAFVVGPIDIPRLVEEGLAVHKIEGMLPTAHYAFLDEFMNSNTPTQHALHKITNERRFENGPNVLEVPLRTLFAATNKLNTDPDLHAMWDRLHIRIKIDYPQDPEVLRKIVRAGVQRAAQLEQLSHTTVTLEQMDAYTLEAMQLPIPDEVEDTFFDLVEALREHGAEVSPRRMVDGMVVVKANAFVRNHETVRVGDLDILKHMWWRTLDERDQVMRLISRKVNPADSEAIEILKDFDVIQKDYERVIDPNADRAVKTDLGLDIYTQLHALAAKGKIVRDNTAEAGASTHALDDVLRRVDRYIANLEESIYGLTGNFDDMDAA